LVKYSKRLLHEVTRPDRWIPVAIYIFFAILAYRASAHIVSEESLPRWLADFAVALLIIGLPIILTTTVIQQGIPRLGRSDPSMQVEFGDDDSDSGGLGVRPAPRGLWRLFTWRNAALGGVAAFTLWLLIAGAWLVLAERLADDARDTAIEASTDGGR
jgi:hypothetical protein